MNQRDEMKKKRAKVAVVFDNMCFICHKKFGYNFHFHHIKYQSQEKKHSDFKNWIEYSDYILPIIKKNPHRFSLLCNTCHRLISIIQSIKNEERFDRLIEMSRKSRK